jgi:hypothetical protein
VTGFFPVLALKLEASSYKAQILFFSMLNLYKFRELPKPLLDLPICEKESKNCLTFRILTVILMGRRYQTEEAKSRNTQGGMREGCKLRARVF